MVYYILAHTEILSTLLGEGTEPVAWPGKLTPGLDPPTSTLDHTPE